MEQTEQLGGLVYKEPKSLRGYVHEILIGVTHGQQLYIKVNTKLKRIEACFSLKSLSVSEKFICIY